MKLIQLYRNILDYCGLLVNDDGDILVDLGDGKTKPFEVENRALGLPTDPQYKKFDPDKRMIFHPLQEHINRGESEVVKALRYHMNVRLNEASIQMAIALLELAGSKALHPKMTPEQRELLNSVPNADIKSAANFLTVMLKRFKEQPTTAVMNIFLKKAGTYKGEKHNRVGVVAFPYYEMFEESDLKLRNNDKLDFVSLMDYIYPGSKTDIEAFNGFSDSNDAPWLDAMLKSSYNLASRLNELNELFGELFSSDDVTVFNTSWVDSMDDLTPLRSEIRRIPSQAGNEGTVLTKDGTEQTTLKPTASSRPVPASRTPEPAPDPYRQVQPPPAPVYPQNPYPPVYPAPGYPAPYPPPAPTAPAVTEDGKLDFRSISNTPAFAATTQAAAAMAGWIPPGYAAGPAHPQLGYNGRAVAPGGAYPGRYAAAPAPQIMQDQYGRLVDQYGRLVPVDAYGRPIIAAPGGISNI